MASSFVLIGQLNSTSSSELLDFNVTTNNDNNITALPVQFPVTGVPLSNNFLLGEPDFNKSNLFKQSTEEAAAIAAPFIFIPFLLLLFLLVPFGIIAIRDRKNPCLFQRSTPALRYFYGNPKSSSSGLQQQQDDQSKLPNSTHPQSQFPTQTNMFLNQSINNTITEQQNPKLSEKSTGADSGFLEQNHHSDDSDNECNDDETPTPDKRHTGGDFEAGDETEDENVVATVAAQRKDSCPSTISLISEVADDCESIASSTVLTSPTKAVKAVAAVTAAAGPNAAPAWNPLHSRLHGSSPFTTKEPAVSRVKNVASRECTEEMEPVKPMPRGEADTPDNTTTFEGTGERGIVLDNLEDDNDLVDGWTLQDRSQSVGTVNHLNIIQRKYIATDSFMNNDCANVPAHGYTEPIVNGYAEQQNYPTHTGAIRSTPVYFNFEGVKCPGLVQVRNAPVGMGRRESTTHDVVSSDSSSLSRTLSPVEVQFEPKLGTLGKMGHSFGCIKVPVPEEQHQLHEPPQSAPPVLFRNILNVAQLNSEKSGLSQVTDEASAEELANSKRLQLHQLSHDSLTVL